jgi:hypothetical protein
VRIESQEISHASHFTRVCGVTTKGTLTTQKDQIVHDVALHLSQMQPRCHTQQARGGIVGWGKRHTGAVCLQQVRVLCFESGPVLVQGGEVCMRLLSERCGQQRGTRCPQLP